MRGPAYLIPIDRPNPEPGSVLIESVPTPFFWRICFTRTGYITTHQVQGRLSLESTIGGGASSDD
jgi:hypothetical protein